MNADLRERLEALAADRARQAAPDAEAALMLGAQRYRWYVQTLYAAVLIVTLLVGGGLAVVGPVGAGETGESAVVGLVPDEQAPDETGAGEVTPGETTAADEETAGGQPSGASDSGQRTPGDGETPGGSGGGETAGEAAGGEETTDGDGGGDSPPPVLNTITLSPAAPVLEPGGQHRFTAEGIYSDGSVGPVPGALTWEVTEQVPAVEGDVAAVEGGVAAVDGTGLVVAENPGTATVTATAGDVVGAAPVVVAPPPRVLTAITVAPEPPVPPPVVLAPGQQQQFTAQGLYSDGTVGPVTDPLAWDVTDQEPTVRETPADVATVDGTGLVVAENPGTATVTATAGDVVGAAPVVVEFPFVE